MYLHFQTCKARWGSTRFDQELEGMKEKHGPEPLLFSGRKEGGGNSLGLAALNNVNRLWNTGGL